MNFSLEVVVLPVADVDRSLAFYTQQAGFALDVDYRPTDAFRLVQLTPPGSACSVQFGEGLTAAAPGSVRHLHVVVNDLEATCRELSARGVSVDGIRHKDPIDTWQGGFLPGVDPQHRDYASFADFADPDGNSWRLQERGFSPA